LDGGANASEACSPLRVAHITLTNNGTLRAPHGTIGNAIRRLREERQWTQEQLAKRLNITQSAIASFESGRICPSIKTAKVMAIEFNVPLEFILAHRRTLFA
jgi:DNA-binding XRE family transcriptional regulator